MSAEMIKIGEIAEQIRGVTYSKELASKQKTEGHLPILRANNITDCGIDFADLIFVPERFVSVRQKLKLGDIVVAASSGSLDVVGKAASLVSEFDGSFGAFCKVIRPSARVAPSYLANYFKTPVYRRTISSLAAGANINNLRSEHLNNLEIPLPPLPEQKRIADILDHADALRAKRRAALAELDTLTQSLFLEMFGDPVTNRGDFPVSRMGDVCDVRDGTHDSPEYISVGGYPLVTSKNLSKGFVDLTDVNLISEVDYTQINKRSKVDRGDIIMPMIGTIGSPVLVEEEPGFAIKNVALIKFTAESPLPIFVRHLLSCHYFDHIVGQKNRGGTQKFVSLGDLRAFPLPLPPVSLQREFAQRVIAVETQKSAQRKSLSDLDTLFAALQHRAFRGELH